VSAVKASDLPARGRETERGRAGESDRDVDEIKKCFLGDHCNSINCEN